MNNPASLTLFPSFNARNLSPSEVAATFVPNEEFDLVWTNNSVVLLGPRGSGKTTLLKMLTMQALHSWNHSRAKEVRARIPFNAIYVPTDIHWQRQLSFTDDQLQRLPDLQRSVSLSAITTNVLSAVCSTMADLLQLELGRNEKHEIALSKTLIREWHLDGTVPCLDLISQALDSRVNELRRIINEAISTNKLPKRLPSWLFLDYLATSAAGLCALMNWNSPQNGCKSNCLSSCGAPINVSCSN
jgi:ABC-type transport system involved in cytochrome c biogenesis ATPase subunit